MELFELPPPIQNNSTCRKCRHRFSAPLNERSRKVLQMCELKKGRNNYGYKTIKVTDKACSFFENMFND